MRFGLVCSLLSLLLSPLRAAEAKPNFVLFLADDISWNDLGCYGHPVIQSPNIDALARSGLRFNNAYLAISSCSPSRCSIITGRYPHNTGAPELHTALPEGQPLFPKFLRDAGYYTVLSGKHHMGENADPAFTTISKGKGPGREGDWVDLIRDRPKDQPFFAWFASMDAHRAWQFSEEAPKYSPGEVIVPPYFFDGDKTRKDITGYYHEVSRFDHYVGLVTAELKKQGVLENTVIIVMADNGRPLPRCKTRLYDSGIKTPFIVHFPAMVNPAETDSIISSIDIAPTVLELAGVKKDPRIQGASFAKVLADPQAVTRNIAFAEHNWHVYRNHERMVRIGDWLYIRNNFPNQQNLCSEAYIKGTGEDLWERRDTGELSAAQSNIFWNPCPPEELYRVSMDPEQLKNLATDPAFKGKLTKFRDLLATWTKQTGDTVPQDPTPHRDAPPGETLPGPKIKRRDFRPREMPGDRTNASRINHPGPILVNTRI